MTEDSPTQSDVLAQLDWTYSTTSDGLQRLLRSSTRNAWSHLDDVNWSVRPDVGYQDTAQPVALFTDEEYAALGLDHSDGSGEWAFRTEFERWIISQFLHGEQAALVSAATLVQQLPTVGLKRIAAEQVRDEARHLDVFQRYLRVREVKPYEVDEGFKALLERTAAAADWDLVFLGMQLLVESLAVGLLRLGRATYGDPLLRDIAGKVLADEARHTTFGVTVLKEHWRELSAAELRDREDHILTSADVLASQFDLAAVWEQMGVKREVGARVSATSGLFGTYRSLAFASSVRAITQVGLLSPRVRRNLMRMGLVRD